jgi:hypothetical protein
MWKRLGYLRWSRIFPLIHLGVCATGTLGALVPGWDILGRAWTFLVIGDLPWSFVYVVVGMTHEWLAVLWIVAVGTSWWYLLGRLAEYLSDRLIERWTRSPNI